MGEENKTAAPAPAPPPAAASAPRGGWSAGRRFGAWINTVVMVVLVAAILVAANYLSARYFVRYDWTVDQEYRLSPRTVSLLAGLSAPVEIYIVETDPRMSFEDRNALERLQRLVEDYRVRSPRVTVETLGFGMDRATYQARLQRLKLQTAPSNQTVIVYANDRSKTIALSAMYEMDFQSNPRSPRMRSFNAESLLTAAILELTGEKPPVVHFARGHGAGEGATEGGDPEDGTRIRWIARRLKERENMEIKPINLLETADIPEDCKAVVIHQPSVRYGEKELTTLRGFLQRGGRVCVMVDALSQEGFIETGLEGLLGEWGVKLGRNVVLVQAFNLLTQRPVVVPDVVIQPDQFGAHPIVDKLKSAQLACKFEAARTVDKLEGADGRITVTPLMTVSEGAWAETSVDQIAKRRAQPDADDPQGSLALAQAATAPVAAGVEKPLSPETRLVVFGSTGFISDAGARDYNNEDLFSATLLWLLSREKDIGIQAKSLSDRRISLEEKHVNAIFVTCVFGLPGLSVILGLGLWFFRRT